MLLAMDSALRRQELIEIGRQCATDRDARKAYHQSLRAWYTRGTDVDVRVRNNKIKTHVRQATAYKFQPGSVRFQTVLPPRYGEAFLKKLEATRLEFHRFWHGSRAGLVVERGVKWAHVYPSVIWKVVPSGGQAKLTLVPDPGDVGVLENDKPFNEQEAIIHFFWLTLPAYDRFVAGHPDEATLKRLARQHAEQGSDDPTAPTVERIRLNAPFGSDGLAGGGVGALTRGASAETEASVEARRVLMGELWVIDDRLHDWRVADCLAPSGQILAVIWNRRTPVLSGTDPFVALTLDDAPDYTWGFSEVDDLSGLQEWREHKMDQIDQLFTLQLKPPIVLGGFGGLSDERAKRLRTPDGVLATSIPNPNVSRLAPTMPPEAFGFIQGVDQMFAEVGGLPLLTSPGGGGDVGAGLRDGRHVTERAALSSARILGDALRVEYAVSEIATLMLRLHRELHADPVATDDGSRFYLTEVPRDIEAEVASHSASPLYAASVGDKFDRLLKAGAISRPSYVRGLDPPMAEELAAEARRIEQAMAKRQETLLQIAMAKAERGRSR